MSNDQLIVRKRPTRARRGAGASPTYRVGYRLKLVELRYGRVVRSFFAAASCCFHTDELNVILAELYTEVGPSAYLMGLEVLTIRRVTWPPSPHSHVA